MTDKLDCDEGSRLAVRYPLSLIKPDLEGPVVVSRGKRQRRAA
jgi:hypothetical protein